MKASKDITSKTLLEIERVFGKGYLNKRIESSYDFIDIANQGLKARAINRFREYFNLSLEDTADMLCVSEPSIYRWTKADKTLDKNTSIKLLEISDFFLSGISLFGSSDNFFKWIRLPNTAIGGREPQELLEIPEGISKLRGLLGRIAHGVYS